LGAAALFMVDGELPRICWPPHSADARRRLLALLVVRPPRV
jgi:hypothetical protein